jgi:patatin-like phospholipase/acyl hydrolase
MSPEFKILSLDGGGIRGVLSCTILKFIEEQTNYPISSLFNVIAGTSTGGIIALGLSTLNVNGNNLFSAADMLNLYVNDGKQIFSKRNGDLLSWISGDVFNKPYDSTQIELLLDRYFSNFRLKDSFPHLLVTTYEIEKGQPFYFSSRLAKLDPREDFPLKEIARSTSAAPTYFKPSHVAYEEQELAFIDGGVFANNPSILAYCEAREIWKELKKDKHSTEETVAGTKSFLPVVAADDHELPFYMLSIGTGYCRNKISKSEVAKWRNKNWFEPLMTNIFMRGVTESTDFTMQHLLPPYKNGTLRYNRLNMEIPDACNEMDNTSKKNIAELIALADKYVKDNKSALLEICKILK